MKTRLLTKFIGIFSMLFMLGCESKPQEPNISQESSKASKVIARKPSVLQQQIRKMFEGDEPNEELLVKELKSAEWTPTFTVLKTELATYTEKNGKRPRDKNIAYAHALLKRIIVEHEKDAALQDLDSTIKRAIEEEKRH